MKVDEKLAEAAELHGLAQHTLAYEKFGVAVPRSVRGKMTWEPRWERALYSVWPDPQKLDELIAAGRKDWALVAADVEKARPIRTVVQSAMWVLADEFRSSFAKTVKTVLRGIFAAPKDFLESQRTVAPEQLTGAARGGYAVYMSLAEDEMVDALEHSLDTLGLDRTWRWTGTRDMARDQYAVRGSKVIQHAYGNHVDKLAEMIIEATDPTEPKTQDQIRRDIREEWNQLTRKQVERIARTETAAVWETANYNAMRANDVVWYEWIVAHGPSIGPPVSYPVCKRCLKRAADGPYPSTEMPDLPPEHPNCRCTLVPSLSHDWLPPARPWHGDTLPLEDEAPSP